MSEPSIHERLKRGETVQVGNGLYALCGYCEKVVKMNKFLFGSIHSCLPDAEKKLKDGGR